MARQIKRSAANVEYQLRFLGFTEMLGRVEGATVGQLYRNPTIKVYLTARLDGRKWTFKFWRHDSAQFYLYSRKKFLDLRVEDLGEMTFDFYTPLQLPFPV